MSMTSKSNVSATMTPRSYLPEFSASFKIAAGKARKMLPPPKCTQVGSREVFSRTALRSNFGRR